MLAPQSFWTWNQDTPASYGATDHAFKHGAPTAGVGGLVTYSFDAASNWTGAEQKAFTSAMALWSAEADIRFVPVGSGAVLNIVRGTDGGAEVSFNLSGEGAVGGAALGSPSSETLSIDTSVAGFGPIGAAFETQGAYPWLTIEHELGHVIGLGHAGAYNEGVNAPQPYTNRDALPLSLMSYNAPNAYGYDWRFHAADGSLVQGSPTTPGLLDIAAAQRLYGAPETTPLSGGQVFGFHSNIAGDIAPFFDFTINTHPVVTLWDAGTGNTLDVSGFSQGSTVNLSQAAFSSVAGLTNNLAIAYGTVIDAAVGGPGADHLLANDDGDFLMGGAGADTLTGGLGLDALFGGPGNDSLSTRSAFAALYGGQGDDGLYGGGYLSGDAGDDSLYGTGPRDTLFGGDGNDHITAREHAMAFGNAGADTMSTGSFATAASLFGGKDDDVINLQANASYAFGNLGDDVIDAAGTGDSLYGGQGNDLINALGVRGMLISGDLGADTIVGSHGADTITGGDGADVLTGDRVDTDPNAAASIPDPAVATSRGADTFVYRALSDSAPASPDHITDFDPAGGDVIDLSAVDAARAALGQAAFRWVGQFDGGAGEAMLVHGDPQGSATLLLDADGDRVADFALVLAGDPSQGGWLIF